jgi:hypothetical protein
MDAPLEDYGGQAHPIAVVRSILSVGAVTGMCVIFWSGLIKTLLLGRSLRRVLELYSSATRHK